MNMGGMGEAKLDGTPFNVLMQQAVKLKTHVHKIDRVRFERPGGGEEHFFCIEAPDWINVIPVTPDGQVLLVRQYRRCPSNRVLVVYGRVAGERAAK